jgi:hypothetical protein
LERREAVALLKELATEQLVQPRMVLVEPRKPNGNQLKIKGDYGHLLIEEFLRNRGFSLEANENFLIIFKP